MEDILLKTAQSKKKCRKCGKLSKRIFNTRQSSGTKVFWTRAMGCAPHEVEKFRASFPNEHFAKDGRMLINGFKHAKKVAKDFGWPID